MTHPGPDSNQSDAGIQTSANVGQTPAREADPPPGSASTPPAPVDPVDKQPDSAESPVFDPGAAADAPPQFLWLRRTDQLFIGVLLGAIVILLTIHALRLSRWGRSPIEIERLPENQYAYRLDINEATWVEWAQLDGIGEVLAQRIVADRAAHGPFRDVEDLQRVNGIGPKILERIRPVLEVREPRENPH